MYRYNPSQYFKSDIYEFLGKNKSPLVPNKQLWRTYKSTNKEIIEREIRILNNMGYTKDPYMKMYKTFLYYYNKLNKGDKKVKTNNKSIKIKISDTFKLYIENHIEVDLKNKILKPAKAYKQFTNKYKQNILDELSTLEKIYKNKDLEEKIKKIYKNHYYYHLKKEKNKHHGV